MLVKSKLPDAPDCRKFDLDKAAKLIPVLWCRSMESVEEVKRAAKQFAALQSEAEAAGEQMHADILDSHHSLQNDARISGQEYRCAPVSKYSLFSHQGPEIVADLPDGDVLPYFRELYLLQILVRAGPCKAVLNTSRWN